MGTIRRIKKNMLGWFKLPGSRRKLSRKYMNHSSVFRNIKVKTIKTVGIC
jgi:hypothetical protein